MGKIDRLGWTDGIAFESYGLKIGIRTNDAGALDRVRACLPPGTRPLAGPYVDYLMSVRLGGARARPNVRNYHLLYAGLQRQARTLDLDDLFQTLENELALFIAEFARKRLFVHAGVVGWQGRALLLPGRTMAGKSSLVAALVRAGASYYSDEFAVLDGHGRVHPYPRLLSLRQPMSDGVRRPAPSARPWRVAASDLGGTTGTEPLPVGLVAMTRYQPRSTWKPRPLSPGASVLELLNNTISAQRAPEMALAVLHRLAPRARALKGPRPEADEIAQALLCELERS